MDYSLLLRGEFEALAVEREQNQIQNTNQASWTTYGLALTAEDAKMITQTARETMREEDLIQVGDSITPRLIHRFLPSGLLGDSYALRVAELTEAFFHIKGELREITASDSDVMLSDNAILYYMYIIYISPACAGDVEEMEEIAQEVLYQTAHRIIDRREQLRKEQDEEDLPAEFYLRPDADEILRERGLSAVEEQAQREMDDYLFHENMAAGSLHPEAVWIDGEETAAYERAGAVPNTDALEVLRERLRRDPQLLIPSEEQEREWEAQAEKWEEEDALAAKAAQKARARAREEKNDG